MGYWDAFEMVVVFEAGVAKLVRAWAHGAGGGGGLWGGARAGEGGVTFVGVAGRVVRGEKAFVYMEGLCAQGLTSLATILGALPPLVWRP